MRVKVGNQKAARYTILDGHCEGCAFYSKSLLFCVSMMNCSINGLFYQPGTSEDIFKLWKSVLIIKMLYKNLY